MGINKFFHKDRPASQVDSSYGSEASRDSYTGASSLSGSENSRPVNDQAPSNGNQPHTFVNNQGQVVTTTTTTTTTTTSGGGGSSSTSGPHESNMMNKLDPRVDSSVDQTEISETTMGRPAPGIPYKSSMRERSPNPPTQPQQQQQQSSYPVQPLQTDVRRERSPGYRGVEPVSPSGRGSNFSYPGRAPVNGPSVGTNAMPQQQQSGSTLQDLKTAAIGIHGAGETLRGTLNRAVDKRFNAPPETLAAHEQVTRSGRSEIESGRLSDQSRQAGGVGTPQAIKGILRKRDGDGQLRVVNE